jgi:thioredoxin reductase
MDADIRGSKDTFVAGDVRRGSVKRLTAAVGEGAMAVHFIHQYCSARKRAGLPKLLA